MRRLYKISIYLFLITLFILVILSTNLSDDAQTKFFTNTPLFKKSSPIGASGNAQLAFYASSGNGTPAFPYILKDYVVDVGFYGVHGCFIQNTDAYFILRNCTFYNGGSGDYGIYFLNVTNGVIENCTSQNNYYGIYLANTVGINITNSTISFNNLRGIYLDTANETLISNNFILNSSSYGLYIRDYSYRTTVLNNTIVNNTSYGIYMTTNCFFSKIINNTLNHNYYGLYASSIVNYTELINNTINFNDQYGIMFNIFCDHNILVNNTANYNYNRGFYFFNTNNTLIGNTANKNGYGFDIDNIGGNNLIDNIANNNTYMGFRIASPNNNLTANSASNNSQNGFSIYSQNNNLINNNASSNLENGLYVSAQFNVFINNSAIENAHDGFWVWSSFNNFTNNTANENGNYGFEIEYPNQTLSYNTANNNTHGFYIDSDNNTLEYNIADHNQNWGFGVQQSNNILYYNNASYNGALGVYVGFAGSNNRIMWNQFYYNRKCISDYGTANVIQNNTYVFIAPQWSNPQILPSSIIPYSPGLVINVSMTWWDDFGIFEVLIEFSGVNYSASTLDGAKYSYSFVDLPVGNYQIQWFATDAVDHWNASNTISFTIVKSSPSVRLFLNGLQGDRSVSVGSVVNMTVTAETPLSIAVYNASQFLTSSRTSFWSFNHGGTFLIVASTPGNENYTTGADMHFLTVVDNNAPIIFNLSTSPGSLIPYLPARNYQFYATVTDQSTVTNVWLHFNSVYYPVTAYSGNNYHYTLHDLPAGNYQYRWVAVDNFGNWRYGSYFWYNVTRATPFVRVYLNGSQNMYTAPTGSIIQIDVTINAPLSFNVFNSSNYLTSSSPTYWNFTHTGLFTIFATVLQNSNYTGGGDVNTLNITDGYDPMVSNILTNPPSPVEYIPGATYQFNATWIDENPIVEVLLEVNNNLNFSVTTSSGSEYYHSFQDLPAQGYQYRWFARDAWNNWGVSSYYWFNLTRYTPNIHLFLNGVEGNYSRLAGNIINITLTTDSPRPVAILNASNFLTFNISSSWNFTRVGIFPIQANSYSNQNYTPASVVYYLNMTDGYSPRISNIITNPTSPTVYSPGAFYLLNATIQDDSPLNVIYIEFNGVNYTITTSVGDQFYRIAQDLPAGNHLLRWYAEDTEGNWAFSPYNWYNISKAPPTLSLFLNGTEGNYTTPSRSLINITVTLNVAEQISVFDNFTFLTHNFTSIWNFTDVGVFKIMALTLGNQNYSAATTYYFLNLTDIYHPVIAGFNGPVGLLASSPEGFYQFSITLSDDTAIDTVIFELDGVNYTVINRIDDTFFINFTALSLGAHQYAWFANDTLNNWLTSEYFSFEIVIFDPFMEFLLLMIILGIVTVIYLAKRPRSTKPKLFKAPKKRPEASVCGVHKKLIEGPRYVCPDCGVAYCLDCAAQLMKKKGNCLFCNKPPNFYKIKHLSPPSEKETQIQKPYTKKGSILEETEEPNYYQVKSQEIAAKPKGEKTDIPDINSKATKGTEIPEQNFYKVKRKQILKNEIKAEGED